MSALKPLTIGHLSTVYHTSFILEGTDWLQKAGIDAKWRLFASGPDIVRAFENKEIDLGYIGLPPVIIGVARGIPFKCIAGGHVEGTVVIAQKEYCGIDELGEPGLVMRQFEGQAIGTPPKGSIHDVIVRELLDKLQYDVAVKNYPWADFVLDALVDREIPAAAGTPPLAVAARRFCGARIVIPPHRTIPATASSSATNCGPIPIPSCVSWSCTKGRRTSSGKSRRRRRRSWPGSRRSSTRTSCSRRTAYRRNTAVRSRRNTWPPPWASSGY